MTGFCNAHIGQRTSIELLERHKYLRTRDLTPGLAAEMMRIKARLESLGVSPEDTPTPPSLLDFLNDTSTDRTK